MKTRLKLSLGSSFVGLLMAVSPAAFAGSFALNENSAVDLGRANSGRVTQIDDASAAFGNPALMTRFERLTITAAGSYINGTAEFQDQGSTDLLGNSLGGDADGFFDDAVVPAFHAVFPLNERVSAGLSVNAPYGLSSTYDENWTGRYQAIGSSLETYNVNPSLAVKISDSFSLGGGVSIQYATAELSSAIDFGAVCFAQVGPATCGAAGLTPQSADGRLVVEGDDISFGYNAGAAFSPTDTLTFGVTYRSKVEHDLQGDASFTVPDSAQLLTASGAFTDTPIGADLPLPGVFEVGVEWQATPALKVSANFNRTDWSQLQGLEVDFDNPAQPPTAEELNYSDSNRYGVGVDYDIASDWTLRAGYAYDESPVSPDFRTARIPDNDRNIYAVGASYKGLDGWQFDVAYNYLDVKTSEFDRVGPYNDRVVGLVTADVNLFSAGVTKRF